MKQLHYSTNECAHFEESTISSKWNEPLGEFHFDPKVTTHEAGVMFARGAPRRNGAKRSGDEEPPWQT